MYALAFICALLLVAMYQYDAGSSYRIRKRIYINKAQGRNVVVFVLAALPIIMLGACRYGIGTDYYNYKIYFQQIAHGGKPEGIEVGYYLLTKLATLISNNSQCIFVLTSIITVTLVYVSIYKNADNKIFSLAIFFLSFTYFFSLNNIRQAIALCGVVFAMHFLENKKWIRFLIVILISGTFHESAFMCLLLLVILVYNAKAIVLLVVSLGWYVINRYISSYIIMLLSYVSITKITSSKLQAYIESGAYIGRQMVSSSVLYFNIAIMIILVFVEYQMSDNERNGYKWRIIKYSQFFNIVFMAMDQSIPSAYRMAKVFSFAQYLFLPNALTFVKNKKTKVGLSCIVLIGFIGVYYVLYIGNSEGVFPYRSIWKM